MESRAATEADGICLFAGGLSGTAADVSGLLGTARADVTLTRDAIFKVRTMLLVDNSRSISGSSQKKIRELLTAVVENRSPEETFCLAVFGEQPVTILPFGTSAEEVRKAIQEFPFTDQNSYLPEAVLVAAEVFPAAEEPCYDRMIIASDGGETKTGGLTEEEVIETLRQKEIPVFSLGSLWNGNPEGQSSLASLARRSGGAYLLLQEQTAPEELLQMLEKQKPQVELCVKVPADQCDGGLRNLQLTFSMEDGSREVLNHEVRMPQAALPTGTPVPTATPVPTNTPVPTRPPALVRTISPTPVPVREADSLWEILTGIEKAPLGIPLFLWLFAVLLLAAGVSAAYFYRKMQKDEAPAETEPEPFSLFGEPDAPADVAERSSGPDMPVRRTEQPPSARTRKSSADEEVTQLLFPEPGEEKLLVLRTLKEPARDYQMPLRSALVAGKSSQSSDLVIEDDPAVSRHHCRFSLEDGAVFLEDMQSRNGTWLNRHKISGKEKVSSGDRIRIGDTELELEIR